MAQSPYDGGGGSTTLDARLPGDYERVNATPEAFGGGIAHGMQELGQGAVKASQFYGQVVADDATNQLFDRWNKRMYGDPTKQVPQPDGTMGQDTGYMGLKGRNALDARPGIEKDMDADIAEIRQNLSTPDQQLAFDRDSRRYRQALQQHLGQHADSQFNAWGSEVNKAAGQTALTSISNTAYDDQSFQHGMADLIHARVKDAQLAGGGDDLVNSAIQSGTQEAWKQRLETISVHNPDQAAKLADDHQKELGHLYEPLANQFRSRATQAVGIGAANDAVAKARSGVIQAQPQGQIPTQALDTIKQFEGYTSKSTWDYKQYSGGYGSRAAPGETFTPEKAQARLIQDAMPVNNWIAANIKTPLTSSQYSGLMSFGYNLGTGGGGLSDLKDDINAGNWQGVADRMQHYNKAGGQVNDDLVKRRFTEGNLVLNKEGAPVPVSVQTSSVSQASRSFLQTSQAYASGASPQATGTANPSVPQVDEAPPMPPAPPAPPETPQPIQQPASPEQIKAAAYQAIHDNPDLSQEAKEHAYREINQQIAEQQVMEQANEKAKKEADEKAQNGYVTRILNGNGGAGIIHQIANDPALKPETKLHLVEAVKRHSGSDVEEAKLAYGPGFWSAYKAVTAAPGDPSRIADPTQLLRRAGPGGDLTLSGVQKLSQTMQQNQKSVNDQAVNTTKVGLLNYAKGKLSFDQEMMFPGVPPLKDPRGVAIFEGQFIPKFEAAYDQWTKDGKDPWQFLTQKNVDAMAEGMRPKAQMAMDRVSASGEAAPPDLNAKLPPAPQGVNQDAWSKVITMPPPMENGKPFPYAAWGHAVSMLLTDPSEKTIQLFNSSKFGKAGMDGKFILDQLREKTKQNTELVRNPFGGD